MRKIETAKSYVEKYIDLAVKNKVGYSKRYIASVMLAENPSLFKDLEDARSAIRRVTGADGYRNKTKKNLAEQFALVEYGIEELPHSEPFVIPSQYKKALWIADLHSRFCDRKALETAVEYGINHGCDSVVILGDFMDFYGQSRFDKNRLIVDQFMDELDWGTEVLEILQDSFGKVFLKKGNHDLRREQYIQKAALQFPEMMGLESYERCLAFKKSTVDFIADYRVVQFGRLNGVHGHEYQGGGGVHVAYNRLNKAMDNVISAHSHIAQSDMRKTIDGSVVVSVTLGCLCDLHPRYNPMNSWTHGFAVIERDESEHFMIDNRVIINGRTYPR